MSAALDLPTLTPLPSIAAIGPVTVSPHQCVWTAGRCVGLSVARLDYLLVVTAPAEVSGGSLPRPRVFITVVTGSCIAVALTGVSRRTAAGRQLTLGSHWPHPGMVSTDRKSVV